MESEPNTVAVGIRAEQIALIEHGMRRSSGRERRLAELAQALVEQKAKLHERAESAEVDRDTLDGMLSEAWSGSRDDATSLEKLQSTIDDQAKKLAQLCAAILEGDHDTDCSTRGSVDFAPRACDCAKSLL